MTVGYVVLGVIGMKALLKQKDKKELTLYLVIMLTALVYSNAIIFDWKLPNPNKLIMIIFDPISHYFFGAGHE